MMKGVSTIIATLLVVLVVVTLAGAYLIFVNSLSSDQTEAVQKRSEEVIDRTAVSFRIINIDGQNVTIQNDASSPMSMSAINVFLDDILVTKSGPAQISAKSIGQIKIMDLWKFGPVEKTLRVVGPGKEDSIRIKIDSSTDGKLLDFRFDEGSGSVANDLSGNNLDGVLGSTITGQTPAWVPGKFGNALQFDGNSRVMVGDKPQLEGMNRLSIEFWIKTSSVLTNRAVVAKYWTGTTSYTARLSSNQIQATIDGSSQTNVNTIAAVNDNQWHHIVATYDGTNAKMYLDGILKDTNALSGTILNSEEEFCVGDFCNAGGQASGIVGIVDEVRVFGVAHPPENLYVMRRV